MKRRKYLATLIVALLAGFGGAAAQPARKGWTPSEQLVAHVDSRAMHFKLPKGFGAVRIYDRYYWGIVTSDGHRLVEGFFVSPQAEFAACNDRGLYCSHPAIGSSRRTPGEIHIVTETDVPYAMGGGCLYVHLEFDVESKKLDILCNSPM